MLTTSPLKRPSTGGRLRRLLAFLRPPACAGPLPVQTGSATPQHIGTPRSTLILPAELFLHSLQIEKATKGVWCAARDEDALQRGVRRACQPLHLIPLLQARRGDDGGDRAGGPAAAAPPAAASSQWLRPRRRRHRHAPKARALASGRSSRGRGLVSPIR